MALVGSDLRPVVWQTPDRLPLTTPGFEVVSKMTPECAMDKIGFGAVGSFTTKPGGCEVPASPALARPQALWSGKRVVTADPSGYHLPVTSPPH